MKASRIACARHLDECGDQVFALRLDGTDPRRLTGGAGQGNNWCPTWSPDGARICFTSDRGGHAGLWLMGPDGSDQRRLTGEAGAEDYEPSWAPDGASVVFSRGDHQADDLWIVDAASGQARRLTDEQRLDVSPAWSPDGRWIVFCRIFACPRGLHIIPAGGGAARFLIAGAHPSWAPDGKRLAFAHGASLWLLPMSAEGEPAGRARPLVCAAEILVNASSWSPDGEKLVFEAQVTTACGARDRLMIVDAAGGEPHDFGPGYQPSWSPWLH